MFRPRFAYTLLATLAFVGPHREPAARCPTPLIAAPTPTPTPTPDAGLTRRRAACRQGMNKERHDFEALRSRVIGNSAITSLCHVQHAPARSSTLQLAPARSSTRPRVTESQISAFRSYLRNKLAGGARAPGPGPCVKRTVQRNASICSVPCTSHRASLPDMEGCSFSASSSIRKSRRFDVETIMRPFDHDI